MALKRNNANANIMYSRLLQTRSVLKSNADSRKRDYLGRGKPDSLRILLQIDTKMMLVKYSVKIVKTADFNHKWKHQSLTNPLFILVTFLLCASSLHGSFLAQNNQKVFAALF